MILFSQMVRRIESEYHAASDPARSVGGSWYKNAFVACFEIAYRIRGDHITSDKCVGVVAALSPRCPWVVNLEWAEAVLRRWAGGGNNPPAVSTRHLRGIAWDIAKGKSPLKAIGGRKCRDFYRAISGEPIAVIDTWAQYIATGENKNNLNRALRYELIQSAYVVAADRLGVSPRELQAITWVSVREREGRQFAEPSGFRLTDAETHGTVDVIPD